MLYALPISVYRDARLPNDCTNGGISSRYDELLLICDDGFIKVDVNNPPENLVRIVSRNIFGKEYKYIEPVRAVDKGCVGYMFGGNVAGSSDSRFARLSEYPLKIHDRQETQEQYNFCSD